MKILNFQIEDQLQQFHFDLFNDTMNNQQDIEYTHYYEDLRIFRQQNLGILRKYFNYFFQYIKHNFQDMFEYIDYCKVHIQFNKICI
ncbi:unnamed protein product [Paramecium octaurelia]|uniref:Uncharacterized protein n=1 Tax=Paramecium octaurelia TaxID=43137 RepID=A0A8S1Y6V8_PAROT|nr:unnamed protein product [Paramecium octaurelia]